MGEVWLAADRALGRDVALRLFRAGAADGGPVTVGAIRNFLRNFLREARAAARLNHPNAVTACDVGKHHGQVFIAMELAAGGSLGDEVRETGSWNRARTRTPTRPSGTSASARPATWPPRPARPLRR
jgi:serine/threonine-protein kinase